MKFKLVEEFDSGLYNKSTIDNLDESINTNLRKFLLSLIDLSGLNLPFENPVVHHTKKNRGLNSVEDLVLMDDRDHRSMHAKYRNKPWDNNAHKPYVYMEIFQILDAAVTSLQKVSNIEERQLNNESKKIK